MDDDDLVKFFRARLDEDEAEARETADADAEFWDGVKDDGTFFAVHDPARVLREVAAKRAIMDEHSPSYPVTYPKPAGQPTCSTCHDGGMWEWSPPDWPCPTVRHLAAVYGDHPDYAKLRTAATT